MGKKEQAESRIEKKTQALAKLSALIKGEYIRPTLSQLKTLEIILCDLGDIRAELTDVIVVTKFVSGKINQKERSGERKKLQGLSISELIKHL